MASTCVSGFIFDQKPGSRWGNVLLQPFNANNFCDFPLQHPGILQSNSEYVIKLNRASLFFREADVRFQSKSIKKARRYIFQRTNV